MHLDRRADDLIVKGQGDDDTLLTTREVADWLGVSESFMKKLRGDRKGPTATWLTPTCVRYKRTDVLAFLEERAGARYGRKAA
jgi:predicted DNA-binding transcriptional regulator AlpA